MSHPSSRHCSCREVDRHLSEFLDGELEPAERLRFVLHLSACIPCAEAAASLAATIRSIHRLAGWNDGWPAHPVHR